MQATIAIPVSKFKPRGILMSLTDGLIGAAISGPLSAFAAMMVGRMTIKQSELTNLRQNMLMFEERLRVRDAEYITLRAEIAKLTLQNEACEEKFGALQTKYTLMETELVDLKRAMK